jgi:hypothetical protein
MAQAKKKSKSSVWWADMAAPQFDPLASDRKITTHDLMVPALGGLSINTHDMMVPGVDTGDYTIPLDPQTLWTGPYSQPNTRAQQIINGIATLPMLPSKMLGTAGHWLEDAGKGVGHYLFDPLDQKKEEQAPSTTDDNFLQAGLLGTQPNADGSVMLDLGKAPGRVKLPNAPNIPLPDYRKSNAAMEAAKPGPLAKPDYGASDALFAQGAPTATSPEDLQKLKKGSILQGISQGFFQADGKSLSDKILAAGIGALGGMGDYSSKEAALSEKDKEAMRQYSLLGAGRQEGRAQETANVLNQQEAQQRAYDLQLAGHEQHQAEAIAQVQQQHVENQFQLQLKQADLDAQYMRDRQTKFLGQVKGGFLMQETDPDGNVQVKVHKIDDPLDMAALTGLDSTQAMTTYLQLLSPGLPKLQGIVTILDSKGAIDAVFGDAANEVRKNAADTGVQYTQFGAEGQKRGLKDQIARTHFDLANLLAQNPDLLKKAETVIRAIMTRPVIGQ